MDRFDEYVLMKITANVNFSLGDMKDWKVTHCSNGAMIFENLRLNRTIQVMADFVKRVAAELELGAQA